MGQILLFSFLIITGHIIIIRIYIDEVRSGHSSDKRLALIFSLGLAITVLISFFVPMILFAHGNIRLSTILVGVISAFIWLILGYPLALILMKLKKDE
jgi:hypothetical protein